MLLFLKGRLAPLWAWVGSLSGLRIGIYAANAGFFLVLAVFPALILLLGLLRHTSLDVRVLTEFLRGILPEALAEHGQELIMSTYWSTSGTVIGISAVTALWSASRGTYGLLTGLNGVYSARETRSWLRLRLMSLLYTFAFLLVLLLTLGLYVWGRALLELAARKGWHFPELVPLRLTVLTALQTLLFCAMYTAFPNRDLHLSQALPGAVLAALGWQIFSALYSYYVEHFARLTSVYGPVYAVALSMLWLYFCMWILFLGGAINSRLADRKQNSKL